MIDRILGWFEGVWCRLFGHDWASEYELFPKLYEGENAVLWQRITVKHLEWCERCGDRRETLFDHRLRPRRYPSVECGLWSTRSTERARSLDR